MTREAGRVLDAEIAEKVMALSVAWIGGDPRYAYLKAGASWTLPVPHYSTEIAAAWLVVEAMWERDWNCDIHVCGDGFICEFDNFSDTARATVDPREGGISLAICRAALQALVLRPLTPVTSPPEPGRET